MKALIAAAIRRDILFPAYVAPAMFSGHQPHQPPTDVRGDKRRSIE